jgi:hypothetical protein
LTRYESIAADGCQTIERHASMVCFTLNILPLLPCSPAVSHCVMTRAICLLSLCLYQLVQWPTSLGAAEELTFSGISLTSQSRIAPGQVMVIKTSAGNKGDSSAQATIVLTIAELPGLQSARQIALEPGQNEPFELFVPMPHEAAQYEYLHFEATLYILDGNSQVIANVNGAPAVSTMRLPVKQGNVFGMAMEPEPPSFPYWYWPPATPQSSYELATAARVDSGGERTSATFEMRSLPLQQVQWNGIDLFIVAEPKVLEDPAAVESLSKFMAAGGRLWVMLDKVPSRLLRPLLENYQSCEEVDRVELNDFVLDIASTVNPLSEKDRRVQSDRSLQLTRVLQTGGQVSHSVDGWPVALTMDIGYGQLLLTTLDSLAWIDERTKQRSPDPNYQSAYETRLWGAHLAMDINSPRSPLPLSDTVEYPLQLIGNPVVPKHWVALALLSFCGILAALGAWLAFAGRLPLMGILSPAAAILCSLGLLLAASWVRRDIPESVSRLQLVEVGSHGNYALVREQTAMYLATAANMQLESQTDGIMRSHEVASTGAPRLVFDDFHHWRVSNTAWPTGAWRYGAEYSLATSDLLSIGRLTSQGMQLSLPTGLPSSLEDPVLNFITGDPLLCQPLDSGLRVDHQQTLDGERWIAASLISDEQQRRLQIYQRFFAPNPSLKRPSRRLFGWTSPWPTSQWSRELKQQGAALVSIPVQLERPSIGQDIYIPHGLIQLQRDMSGGNHTTVFDDRTGTWRTELSIATEASLEFLLPEEVVPLGATAIEFELDVKAPQRKVSVVVETEAGPITVVELDSPSIPWKAKLETPAILKALERGRLRLSLLVSDVSNRGEGDNPSNVITWQVDHFHAAVRGQVLASSTLSQGP